MSSPRKRGSMSLNEWTPTSVGVTFLKSIRPRMINDEHRELSKAKNIAFRSLKIRERSVFELREKLALKKVPKVTIDRTIEFLLAKKFLDDRIFTRNWIRYRRARPFGPKRIKLELRQKVVDEEIIVQELGDAFDGFNQEEVIQELASRRAARYRDEDPIKRKKKVFDFLARRGFSLEMIMKAIKKI